MSTVNPGAGTKVDDVICHADGFLVVLNHHHRIADIPHSAKGAEQLLVIPLVKANAGLVEDIDHPGKLRAHLAGEPDALRFAARQGWSETTE